MNTPKITELLDRDFDVNLHDTIPCPPPEEELTDLEKIRSWAMDTLIDNLVEEIGF